MHLGIGRVEPLRLDQKVRVIQSTSPGSVIRRMGCQTNGT